MSISNVIAETDEDTVISEYTPVEKKSESYKSEADLEKEFISMLTEEGYEYADIHDENALIENFRTKIEKLNSISFSDSEWDYFFNNEIANKLDSFLEKTRTIQEDYIKVLKRDDGSSFNIKLIDKENIHNNSLQVIHQYAVSKETSYENFRFCKSLLFTRQLF